MPGLRAQAELSDDELENGMTISKASARTRLTEALLDLAEFYAQTGQHAKKDALWDGELGALYSESTKVRWD